MALSLAVLAFATPFIVAPYGGGGLAQILAGLYLTAAVVVSTVAYRGDGSVLCVFDQGLLSIDGQNDAQVEIAYWRELANSLTRGVEDVYVNGLFVVVEEILLYRPRGVRLRLDHYERPAELVAAIESGIARSSN